MAKEPNFNPELGSPEAYLELMTIRVKHAQENFDDAVSRNMEPQIEASRDYLQEQQTNLQNFINNHPEIQDLVNTNKTEVAEEV